MKTKVISLVIASLLIALQSRAQSVTGFWEVNKVSVGDRTMTPVAKWFKINKDQTFQSGNGWTQNSIGTWTFDSKMKEYLPLNKNGIKDEFGAFQVSFSGNNMIWKRLEDVMKVVVTLAKIDELPMSPADQIIGLWDLSNVEKEGKDVSSDFDPNDKQYLFIRPDRLYRMRKPDETFANGYWHMDGHKPEFRLLNFNREEEYQIFSISFQFDQLIMKQKDGDQLVLTYQRLQEFPE